MALLRLCELHELAHVCGSQFVHLCKMSGLDEMRSEGFISQLLMLVSFLKILLLLSNFSPYDSLSLFLSLTKTK